MTKTLENTLGLLSRDYGTLFQFVAAPSLEHTGDSAGIYGLLEQASLLRRQPELSRRQRKRVTTFQRTVEILALLAHLKLGDYSLMMARQSYEQHRKEPTFLERGVDKSVDYASVQLHIENARANYGLAQRRFGRLQEKLPLTVRIAGVKEPVVKFRGDSIRVGNYLTRQHIEERSTYVHEIYHGILYGHDIPARFEQWTDTVGEGFLEIKPYVKN